MSFLKGKDQFRESIGVNFDLDVGALPLQRRCTKIKS
jgi:hypothetical protein